MFNPENPMPEQEAYKETKRPDSNPDIQTENIIVESDAVTETKHINLLNDNFEFEAYARGIFYSGVEYLKDAVQNGRMDEKAADELREEIRLANRALAAGDLKNSALVEVISKYESTEERQAKGRLNDTTQNLLGAGSAEEMDKAEIKIAQARKKYEVLHSDRFAVMKDVQGISAERLEAYKIQKAKREFTGLLLKTALIEDEEQRNRALKLIAAHMAGAGNLENAKVALKLLEDDAVHDEAVKSIVHTLAWKNGADYEAISAFSKTAFRNSALVKEAEADILLARTPRKKISLGEYTLEQLLRRRDAVQEKLSKIKETPQMQALGQKFGQIENWLNDHEQYVIAAPTAPMLAAKALLQKAGLGKIDKGALKGGAIVLGLSFLWLFTWAIEKTIKWVVKDLFSSELYSDAPAWAKRMIEGSPEKATAGA